MPSPSQTFDWIAWVLQHTGSEALVETSLLQHLWGGYGQLLRLGLVGGKEPSVILKRVIPPAATPGENVSDQRKRRSYQVEQSWYRSGALLCDDHCRVARCLAVVTPPGSSEMLLLLEDLGNAGFAPARPPTQGHLRAGLRWLAAFHSRFLGAAGEGLWPQGGYWHLDTRYQEWAGMPSGPLKDHARTLDRRLKDARFQTLMHGDAKPANFCWGSGEIAAAVDFQYVGKGCGIRDVAYFLDCCLGDDGCQRHGQEALDLYFASLRGALGRDGHGLPFAELQDEWRQLFPVAWSDFQRFYQGWGRPAALEPFSQHQLRLALKGCDA